MLKDSLAFHISILSDYVKGFGVVRGAACFLVNRICHYLPATGTVTQVRSPDNQAIFIRSRTTDLRVFEQTFLCGDGDVRKLAQFNNLKIRYENILHRGKIPIIIDGGANIGTVSVLFAHLFPNARIVSVEPDEKNFAMAIRNTEPFNNVYLRRSALWSSSVGMRFSTAKEHAAAYAISLLPIAEGDPGPSGDVVTATTIDDIMSEHADGELFLLKVDIEGAEAAAIAPDARWAQFSPVCIVEPHDWLIEGNASLKGLLSIPSYREGDIVVQGEYLVFFPATGSGAESNRSPALNQV
jgi:FkbM family methyltransferase